MKYVYNILKNVVKLISRKNPPKNNENIREIEIMKNFVKSISQKQNNPNSKLVKFSCNRFHEKKNSKSIL